MTQAPFTAVGKAYGRYMPIRTYRLHYSCGHRYHVRIASHVLIPRHVGHPWPCSKCYTGPYGTYSWD